MSRVFTLLHFCNIMLSICARCMQIIYCKRISRYFSLLDGYAISFNSPTKFTGEKVGDAHRGYAIRWTRTIYTYIRRYIFTPSCDCISSKFSICLFSLSLFFSPCSWQQKNEPYPTSSVHSVTRSREINSSRRSRVSSRNKQ